MSSAVPNPVNARSNTTASSPAIANGTTTSLSGAVPAQLPVRSYANATKTATPPIPAGASAPAQNAKPASDTTQMNGTVAQGGSQPANNHGMNGHGSDHSRKASVVISASGTSGQYPNGGPVQNGNTRPAIAFGSIGASGADSQGSAPFAQNNASLPAPSSNPRVTSPAHSPSPIPQPAASGGRPPSISATNNGGIAFGTISADTEMMRGGQGIGQAIPIHERRPSTHSMQSDPSNQGVNMAGRPPFNQHGGSGRGRGAFNPQQQYMGSPGPGYRPMPGQQQRGPMPQFGQQGAPPGSPFRQPAGMSPAQMHAQPHFQPNHMGANQQMQYGGYPGQQLNPQHQQTMYGMPYYDPNAGHYAPYYPQQFYGQAPASPRPGYPTPYQMPPNGPPYHPPGTPGAASMNRSTSQASERPPSSIGGHPQTPASNAPAPSHTPNAASQPGTGFVKPQRKSNAIKITDAQGNAVDFKKPAASPSAPAQSGTPVIVSTPSNPTPPPRVPSTQHNRTESKSAVSSEQTKNDFAAQVRRKAEEEKRKAAEDEAVKAKKDTEASDAMAKVRAEQEEVAQNEIKKAAVEAEEAAAKSANDKKAEEDAAAAKKAVEDEEAEKTRKEEEENERLEREIAEMEAREKEEEERERAYNEKKAKEKAAQAARDAERAAKADEELKRQEREAEAREEAREKERQGGGAAAIEGPDDESKSLFAQLKKHPELGSAPASGTETPASEGNAADQGTDAEPSAAPARAAGTSKPKPAHLKLETNKPVERAEPTPGMQSLKSARFLTLKEEAQYPSGFKSPNPALNQSRQKGKAYDKDFLLQFQSVFKEKPSVDWDQKIKETLGPSDEPGSARPQSARTPSGAMSRGGSNRPGTGQFGGQMGAFAGPIGGNVRGTTSEQRFAMSNQMGTMGRPGAPGTAMSGRQGSNLGMGAPGAMMSRTNSGFNMPGGIGPGSPRNPSARGGKGGSKRDGRDVSKRQEAEMAAKMPLTAGMDLAPLEKSQTGWKPTSIGQAAPAGPDPSGNMAPDMVQRKVKAALNKMTPEKFDKIADQILEIAAQSKNEQDGRTLRQVIQLTFEKACDEAHWAGMYAKFCHKMLTTMSTEIRDETIKDKAGNPVVGGALFRKYLLNRCQEEFERGWEANLPSKPEGENKEAALLSEEYYIAAAAKRRGLGLIQFIGQLYKLRMLTLRIMHECVIKLLNFEGDPDEAAVENLTTLLKAVGASMVEEEQGRNLIQGYFDRIENAILNSQALGSRPKFMVMDLIDLKKAGWKSKDSEKGPKTIQQIHEEAEAAAAKADMERAKTQRGGGGGRPQAGRGDARNFSGGMPPPQDYTRTNVAMDDLRRLQARGGSNPRPTGATLGPGGGLGPSALGSGRAGSRRGAGGLGPGSASTSRTNTPPVDKKEEPSTAQNAFSALAALDPSGEQPEETPENRSKSPAAGDNDPNA